MAATLVFTPVDNADIVLLLRALQPQDLTVVEDLKQHDKLEVTIKNAVLSTRKAVLVALAGLTASSDLLGVSKDEKIMVEQWLDFACNVVRPEIMAIRDMEEQVFRPLHTELARKTFIAGGTNPSIADWTLFSLLFPKIKGMTPSIASRYYRLVRWLSYLQHLLLATGPIETKGDKDVSAFVPATFDLTSIKAALDGVVVTSITSKEEKKRNGKKSGKLDEKSEVMDKQSLHPFARVDLRVGKIVKVEKHPNADRLYVEHVDLGEEEPRVVVSGLVEHVPIDELQDRLCIFICNLKPATLCKVLSSAMLLVAKDETGLLEPLIPPAGCVAGDRISIDGVTPQPDEVIKPKDTTWESVRTLLAMTNGIAHYESSPLIAGGKGNITSTKVFSGIIS